MSKIAILCDTHFGIKNSSDFFLDYQERFFRDVFFPYCLNNDIKTIIHLGDYFDHRKHIPVKVMNRSRKCFLDKLREYHIHMHIIPGNHDVLFRSTNDICSLKETLGYYTDCVTIYMQPTTVNIEGQSFCMLPWINENNIQRSIEAIQKTVAPVLCSHLELGGFQMMKGVLSESRHNELSPKDLEKFDYVFTGHFHTRSSSGNIHYLGTQIELTWADCDDQKYFHIYDTDTNTFEKVKSPEKVFHKIIYNDTKNPEQYILDKENELRGNYIRIIVEEKTDTARFESFIDSISLLDPYDLKINEDYSEFKSGEDDMDLDVKDTIELVNRYIDNVSTDLDKDRLKQIVSKLYYEAQTIEL